MSAIYNDRILPNQDFNSNLYENDANIMDALSNLLHQHTGDIEKNSFKLNEHHRVSFEEMSTPPVQLSLLRFLIDIVQAKKFLEIGTFIGNTAMHVANFMGKDSEVVTIEKFDEFADLAQKNFEDNGLDKNIKLHVGDAYEVMKELPDNYFDFIYVDGDKGRYLDFTKLAEKKLSSRGIILVDDVFFHGDVLNNDTTSEKGKGCKELLEYYKSTDQYSKYVLPISNGILLLYRNG